MEEGPVEGVVLGIMVVGGAVGAILVLVTLRVFRSTLAMWLRVELRAFIMMTGFILLVLLFINCLELGGHVPLAGIPSCLHF
jgi:hypothetical protein